MAVNFIKLLIPIIRLLLLVFQALDQFLGLGHTEKFGFTNIPETITVAIFRVKLAIIWRSLHTRGSFSCDKCHLLHPTAISPHVWAVDEAACYYDNKATQN
jgi:hypothetical protein